MPQSIRFRLEYWKDGDWYVGRLPQVPGVFSQGATLEELEENIRDAYRLMLEEQTSPTSIAAIHTKDIEVPA
jgi:predicted RNase H-like HicB family nuclease